MASPRSPIFLVAWALCVLPIQAWFWNRHENTQPQYTPRQFISGAVSPRLSASPWGVSSSTSSGLAGWNASTARSPSAPTYSFSAGPSMMISPTVTSQGMIVTSIVPQYEVCNLPGASTTSCSTVLETLTVSSCFAIVTGFFTKVTVSDCNESITFSSKNSYSLVTTPLSPTTTVENQARNIASMTTYVESIVSYYVAPWQSLAANSPSGITLIVCKTDYVGYESCVQIQEVWMIRTEYIPVIVSSELAIARSFSSPVVLLFGTSQSMTAGAGNFDFSTHIEYSSMSANATTSTSTIGTPSPVQRSTTINPLSSTATFAPIQSVPSSSRKTATSRITVRKTIYVTMGVTITKTQSGDQVYINASTHLEPATTRLLTVTITRTATADPQNN